jgi:hypothetical protein
MYNPFHRIFQKTTNRNTKFVKALAEFIDTLPFLYITVIVDKKTLFDSSTKTKIKKPWKQLLKKHSPSILKRDFLIMISIIKRLKRSFN